MTFPLPLWFFKLPTIIETGTRIYFYMANLSLQYFYTTIYVYQHQRKLVLFS